MKVKELVAALKEFDQELEVYSVCDHGQSPEKSCLPSICWTNSADNRLDDNYTTYEEDAAEYGYEVKVVLL